MASLGDGGPSLSVGDVKLHDKPPLEGNVPFSTVPLDEEKGKKKKIPRRILHFSDGILEEYSTDEEEAEEPKPEPVDPKNMTWAPWFWYYIVTASCKSLSAVDFMGEKLAWFFGITSPKYQTAIDEFHRLQAEEERENAQQEREEEAERQRQGDEMSQIEGAYESVYRQPNSKEQNETISEAESKPMVTRQAEEGVRF